MQTTIYFAQQIDNSRLRRVADPRRSRELLALAACASLVFLLLLGYGWQRFQIVHLGYSIARLDQQAQNLRAWNQGLRLEQASLRDPMRIYTVARQELGLASPQPGQVLPLEPAGGSATPVLAEFRIPAPPVHRHRGVGGQ